MPADKSAPEIRVPRQQRSRERVDAILDAARVLIVEKGSTGLKIQEIAAQAGVTAGSMYQYFPNKSAILQALAEQYFDDFHELLKSAITDKPKNMDEAVSLLHSLLDQFLLINSKDPVLRDIWLSVSADKSMRDLDIHTSRRNTELLFANIQHLFPQAHWDEVQRFLLLLSQITPAAIRLALSAGPDEAPHFIAVAKRMMATSLQDWATLKEE